MGGVYLKQWDCSTDNKYCFLEKYHRLDSFRFRTFAIQNQIHLNCITKIAGMTIYFILKTEELKYLAKNLRKFN